MDKIKIQDLEEGKIYTSTIGWEDSILSCNNATAGYFTENQKEIDWSKVPRGTKVQVRDEDDEEWENKYLISFDNEYFNRRPYYVSRILDDDYVGVVMEDECSHWGQCRIHKSVEIPYEWYKD